MVDVAGTTITSAKVHTCLLKTWLPYETTIKQNITQWDTETIADNDGKATAYGELAMCSAITQSRTDPTTRRSP